MDKFIEEISSVYWWIGVVFVGIVINIASSYIKRGMESNLAAVSEFWKRKKKKRAELKAKKLEILKNNPDLRLIYALTESRYRIRSIGYIIFAITFMGFSYIFDSSTAVIILNLFGAISMLIGLDDHRDAIAVKNLVKESIEGLDELDT